MLIGTAGHIDHGKTTLVRALTGVDTDRLPEEKRRGISIDLGYAYLPAAEATEPGAVLGFIDVPGHERFVPTMLAGATGIDAALLVIAADDGPMPQTREHLDILRLLGVERLWVALTKVDRASAEQRSTAEAAIAGLLDATPYAGAPVFPVAAPSGLGVGALRDALFALSGPGETVPGAAPLFRLAIDRSFAIAGAGTVVTGTVHAGQVRVGDTLHLAKKTGERRVEVRVRALHANNRAADVAGRGARCALNLAGVAHQEAERGDWVLSPSAAAPSRHLDVELLALPGTDRLLRPGVDLHLHHGTLHGMARLVPLDEAGRLFQIVATVPLHACHGDRLVLRDASGQRTLAGARVLDPAAPQRHRRTPGRLAQLAALRIAETASRLAALIEASPAGIDLDRYRVLNNDDTAPPADALVIAATGGRPAFAGLHLEALRSRVTSMLAGYHERHPDELGLERDRLRRFAAPQVEVRVFPALLGHWLGEGAIARSGALWHLPAHRVELTGTERLAADRALPLLLESPFDPPWVRDIAGRLGEDEAALRLTLRKLAAQGEVFQIVRDLFYHREAVGELGRLVRTMAEASGAARAATLRDAIGGGRKRAIQILEFFDRVGFTRKVGAGQAQAHVVRGEAPVWKE